MFTSSWILHFLFVIGIFQIIHTHKFQLKNCDATAPLQVDVTKFPTPFVVKNNGTFQLSANMKLKSILPKGIFVKISMAKKIGIWVRIPCLGCDFGLDCSKVPQLCLFRDMCENCELCANNIKLQLPNDVETKIPGFVPDFVIDGDYWVKLQLVDEENHQNTIACLEIYTNLSS